MGSTVAAAKSTRKKTGRQPVISWNAVADQTIVASGKIEKVIKKTLAQLPALTTLAIVETTTGTWLAHLSQLPDSDPTWAAACGTEMIRQQQQAMVALNMRGERLTDILIPFRKQLHLIRLAKSGQWFGYLVVQAQDSTLALAREVLQALIP